MSAEFSELPLIGWIALAAILLPQSLWLFWDARKKGASRWFWGIWGLIQFPCPIIFYFIIVRKVFKRKKVS